MQADRSNPAVFIIAEAGVNHNGDEKMAFELVDRAAEAGADCVKFQTYKTEALVTRAAAKADYQKVTTGAAESQFDMLKKLELSHELHVKLMERCRQRKIQFLSTPFDLPSVDYLARDLQLPSLKLPSGELTNALLFLRVALTGKPVIMSSGNANLGEIESALGVLAFGYSTPQAKPSREAFEIAFTSHEGQAALLKNVRLLHCTSEYPTPFEDVNLRAMDTLAQAFGLPVGLSDHTRGISIPIAAVARGATIIEKHFTLDKKLPGPDHPASLEPGELADMVRSIREVERALGSRRKFATPSEARNKIVARKSLVASAPIRKGERFSEANLTTKRPGSGLSPYLYWDWLDKSADHDYQPDELIK